ncbi:uroporphyrinogen-III synthase [Salinisphaera sp. USBA-960]|uniref:uroporphyrinogen-III synthase n=1 Tax=Salinisphaera orenii TaxID=856731 RepID=UPI0013A610CC|nr:uroporphyrinogen-III synthase [Salifodinibacter halophilus]NNC25952.1 uroporphyrinogen-III synthase [Salifodinibacter halophilus]
MNRHLADRRVWLTRPAGQNAHWANALTEAGAMVHCQPLLTIDQPIDPAAAVDALERAESADWVIASSTNAIDRALSLRPDFAPRGQFVAVGTATAAAFERAFGRRAVYPERFDADALLALPELAEIAGRRIAILAGEGGRTVLKDQLTARAAIVDKIATYRRVACDLSRALVTELVEWSHAVVVTSGDSLANLCRLLDLADIERDRLPELVLPSQRAKSRIDPRRVSMTKCRVLERMDAESLLAALANPSHGH